MISIYEPQPHQRKSLVRKRKQFAASSALVGASVLPLGLDQKLYSAVRVAAPFIHASSPRILPAALSSDENPSLLTGNPVPELPEKVSAKDKPLRSGQPNLITAPALSDTSLAPWPAVSPSGEQQSLSSAAAPKISLVIDDLGLNAALTRRAIDLPAPLTLSLLPYGEGLEVLAGEARDVGHELLLHLPMEPQDLFIDPGPNALLVGLSDEELLRRLNWGLDRFTGYVGVNNHMGSYFTRSLPEMTLVLQVLKERGLLFLDSLTIADSAGVRLAQAMGLAFAKRDLFLDTKPQRSAIDAQLVRLEALARKRGWAIALAHPYETTLSALADWLPMARERGFAFVPISEMARIKQPVATQAAELSLRNGYSRN